MKKWHFHVGIHRGTITSRDSEPPKEMDSLAECEAAATKARRDYAQLGCQIWFCYAMSPEGERHTLIPGEPYVG
jgi:hypothetical protein